MDEVGDDVREAQHWENAAEDGESGEESGEESDEVVRDAIAQLQAGKASIM